MKKVFVRILCFALLAVLTCMLLFSCSKSYRPLHDESSIKTIYIVDYDPERIERIPRTRSYLEVLDVLATIQSTDDMDQFMKDFAQLEGGPVFTDPKQLRDRQYCIVFLYENEDYSIVGRSGETQYISGYNRNDKGFWWFDEEDFNQLIEKYITALPSRDNGTVQPPE